MRSRYAVTLVLITISMFAQTALLGRRYLLMPLGDGGAFPGMLKNPNLVCGKYFVLMGGVTDPADGKRPMLYLRYHESVDIPDSMIMGRDKFVVVIDDTRKIPIVTLSRKEEENGQHPFYWLLRLSRKDWLSGKPCIPDPPDLSMPAGKPN